MLLTVWRHKWSVLVTIGDAIQSFLDRPDHTTRDISIYSTDMIRLLFEWQRGNASCPELSGLFQLTLRITPQKFLSDPRSKQWRPRKRRWSSAVPIPRWLLCSLLYVHEYLCNESYVHKLIHLYEDM